MMQADDPIDRTEEFPDTGFRLVRIIILETLAVLLLGLLALGIAGELGYYRAGIIVAIAIWVLVSPVIEIATVMRARAAAPSQRQAEGGRTESATSSIPNAPNGTSPSS